MQAQNPTTHPPQSQNPQAGDGQAPTPWGTALYGRDPSNELELRQAIAVENKQPYPFRQI